MAEGGDRLAKLEAERRRIEGEIAAEEARLSTEYENALEEALRQLTEYAERSLWLAGDARRKNAEILHVGSDAGQVHVAFHHHEADDPRPMYPVTVTDPATGECALFTGMPPGRALVALVDQWVKALFQRAYERAEGRA